MFSLLFSFVYMEANTLNLNDDDYLSVEDMMAENEDDQEIQDAQGDSVTSHAKTKGNKRRHSMCLKNFSIVGDRLPDGTYNVKCNHCNQPYNLDLNRNGTNTMLRHSKRCSKTPGCTPGSNKKLDMIVIREMMVMAIVEHNLPYQFVEYRRVRILAIAAVLDPRLKFKCLEYCYTALNPSTSKAKMDHIRKKMEKLFGVYKKNTKATTATTSETTMENSLPAGYGGFYAFITQNAGEGKSALDVYLAEPPMDYSAFPKLDVLKY
ncbi:uncharacterized protein LOC103874083 [Brassica rapa]|uniref:uncharacterized protein LOC103874083 n=1 Tax=Brassica campestris TaxID=3711 RepID=UPI00142E47E0|nr:uncharacterized protein LOC103874083 [Brassica rapa]XP_033129540.1 uncharacterized protein LOC103874083 [Brassica rapa]